MADTENYTQNPLERFRLDCDPDHLLKKYPKCIKTGYKTLDERICGGLMPGLIVLGGASSLGKSTFALNLATNISKRNVPVLYYSLEMSAFSIAEKNVCRASRELTPNGANYVTQSRFDQFARSEKKDNTLKELIDKAAAQSQKDNKNLYIIDYEAVASINKTPNSTSPVSADTVIEYTKNVLEWFKAEQKNDKPSLVVIVDYLQILSPSSESDNRTDKQIIDENIRKLWILSHEIEAPVLVLSSVNRDAYDKPISLSSFKESGGIEYTADLILGMQFSLFSDVDISTKKASLQKLIREEKEKNTRSIELCVLKNRFGPTGKAVSFTFEADVSRFAENVSGGAKLYTSANDGRENTAENSTPNTVYKGKRV